MEYFRRFLFPLLLISLLSQYTSSCKNFFTQHCVDIPLGFKSISSIKCIQLIPIQFDLSIEYPVQNYILIKAAECFNIQLYNSSSSSILFSNECRERCPEQYCLLFDNQPNASVINIFFSQSSTYELNNISSYDYSVFDTCGSTNGENQTLLIIVYVLCSIVALLTIIVITKYILSCIVKRKEEQEGDPYNWRWLVDVLCCNRKRNPSPNRPANNLRDSVIAEHGNQSNTNNIRLADIRKVSNAVLEPSNLTGNIIFSGSNITQQPHSYTTDSSGSSSEPRRRGLLHENNMLTRHGFGNEIYVDFDDETEENDSIFTVEKTPGPPLRQRISDKVKSILTPKPSLNEQNGLGIKESLEKILMRF